MFYTTPTEVIMSKQNVLGAKQKVLNDKPMLKKRFKPSYKCMLNGSSKMVVYSLIAKTVCR